MEDLKNIAKKAVQKAQALGARMSEAFLISSQELSVDVINGEVETMKLAGERGIGLRVIRDWRMGFAYSSDLSDSAIEEIIRQAIDNSEKTTPDKFNSLPSPGAEYPRLKLSDPTINQVSVEKKIEFAKEVERAARSYDPRVKITERSSYFDASYEVIVVNSLGIEQSYQGTYCGSYAYVVAEENGDSQTGFGFQYAINYNDLDPRAIGREAGEKAVRALGARTVPTQKTVVVFDPFIGTNFLGVIAPALSAESVQKGKSLFAGKVGQKVASDKITIVDDGTLEKGIDSSPFDGEGVPTSRTVLVEKGQLKGFLHNTYTAAKDGVISTGNGTRGSFKSTPEVGTTNFFISPGNITREDLLKDIKSGLYITDVMGMHTANPISGDFSVGASGIWIENGELTRPVRGVAIAGNIIDLLNAVDGVANDLRFFGGTGSPTIRIAQMTVSGA